MLFSQGESDPTVGNRVIARTRNSVGDRPRNKVIARPATVSVIGPVTVVAGPVT